MERYILELPQDSLIITIQRENPPWFSCNI